MLILKIIYNFIWKQSQNLIIFNKVTLPNIVLKPRLAWRVDSADPGLKLGRVEEKTGEGKTWCDLAGWPDDPVANPLTFFFFFLLKRRRFDFFKKELIQSRPDDPVKTRNPGLGPGWPPGQVLKLCCQIYFL